MIQKKNERLIVPELLNKLKLGPDDTVLDIGSGTGNLTIPISFLVGKITALDHGKCLESMRKRFPKSENIIFLPGNILDININTLFSKILLYSVLHYLSDSAQVLRVIKKTARLLESDGILLLGDIPNINKLDRFLSTNEGKDYYAKFIKNIPNPIL